jgi:DUF1009 family protein
VLAIVAGEGALPGMLLETLEDAGRPICLAELEGHPSDLSGLQAPIRFRIETLGSFIADLTTQGVRQICFAGRVARPPLDPARIDAQTMPLVPRMMAALQQGDDAALRMLLSFFEEAGIEPLGAHQLRPDLLPPPGVLGQHRPGDTHKKDADRGAEVLAAMAQADVGQSCIIARGQALALEALPGTDWMMRSLVAQEGGALGQGAVLVKAAKPGQELRIDMPTIGPDTLRRAAELQLAGVVIEAHRVMMLDAARCIEIADRAELFLWVRP